jgi:cellulose synthase/poly-beta-1,6-N-acetylglucosamine synthase-like glycosyltransferase
MLIRPLKTFLSSLILWKFARILLGVPGVLVQDSSHDVLPSKILEDSRPMAFCEDMSSSVHLFKKGWSISYAHEDLQIGLQPDSLFGHVRQQRIRWCNGAVQTGVEHGWFIRNTEQMTALQRITLALYCAVLYILSRSSLQTIFLLLIISFLFTGSSFIAFGSVDDIRYQASLNAANFIAMKLFQ